MEEIFKRLQASTPNPYIIEWNTLPATPIRYRIDAPKEKVEVYNFLWSEAITKITGVQSFDKENFTRFTVPFQKTNISISIFPTTGTIMLQSNSAPYWADQYMHRICEYVRKDEKGYLTPSTCVVCNKDGNNSMVVCDNEYCQSWTHNDCAGLTEEAARSSIYCCKICVDEYIEKQSQDSSAKISTPISKSKTSTPNKTKNSSNNTSNDDSEPSIILDFSKNKSNNDVLNDNSTSPLKDMQALLADLSQDKSMTQTSPENLKINYELALQNPNKSDQNISNGKINNPTPMQVSQLNGKTHSNISSQIKENIEDKTSNEIEENAIKSISAIDKLLNNTTAFHL